MNLYLRWQDTDDLLTRLTDARLTEFNRMPITLGTASFVYLRRPKHRANGFNCRWFLDHPDFTLALRDPELVDRDLPNARLEFKLKARLRGLPQAWFDAQHVLRSSGVQMLTNQLARVDLAIDLLDQPFDEIAAVIEQNLYATQATKSDTWHGSADAHSRDLQTITFGSRNMLIRLYDKHAQLRHQPLDHQQLEQQLWFATPTHVTRVEYQMCRPTLRKMGIDSLEHWLTHRASIMLRAPFHRLRWFRLLAHRPSRGNQSRTPDHPIWQRLRKQVEQWSDWEDIDPGRTPAPLPRQPLDIGQLVDTGLSYLLTAATEGDSSLPDLIGQLFHRLIHDPEEMHRRLYAKQVQRGYHPDSLDTFRWQIHLAFESLAKALNPHATTACP